MVGLQPCHSREVSRTSEMLCVTGLLLQTWPEELLLLVAPNLGEVEDVTRKHAQPPRGFTLKHTVATSICAGAAHKKGCQLCGRVGNLVGPAVAVRGALIRCGKQLKRFDAGIGRIVQLAEFPVLLQVEPKQGTLSK